MLSLIGQSHSSAAQRGETLLSVFGPLFLFILFPSDPFLKKKLLEQNKHKVSWLYTAAYVIEKIT